MRTTCPSTVCGPPSGTVGGSVSSVEPRWSARATCSPTPSAGRSRSEVGRLSPVPRIVVLDPFAGSCNTLHWILRAPAGLGGPGLRAGPDGVRARRPQSRPAWADRSSSSTAATRRSSPSDRPAPDAALVVFVAPPWGTALDEREGLDLRGDRAADPRGHRPRARHLPGSASPLRHPGLREGRARIAPRGRGTAAPDTPPPVSGWMRPGGTMASSSGRVAGTCALPERGAREDDRGPVALHRPVPAAGVSSARRYSLPAMTPRGWRTRNR